MSKEKQIAEIGIELSNALREHDIAWTNYIQDSKNYPKPMGEFRAMAEALYNAGYRKQSENTVELPCKVGDKVWCISNYTKPKEFQITILTISENHYSFVIEANKGVYKHYCDEDSVGKYVFFTKEEAEKALVKMKGGAE